MPIPIQPFIKAVKALAPHVPALAGAAASAYSAHTAAHTAAHPAASPDTPALPAPPPTPMPPQPSRRNATAQRLMHQYLEDAIKRAESTVRAAKDLG